MALINRGGPLSLSLSPSLFFIFSYCTLTLVDGTVFITIAKNSFNIIDGSPMPWLIPLLQPNFGYGRGVLYLSLYIFGGSAAPSCLQIVYIYIFDIICSCH